MAARGGIEAPTPAVSRLRRAAATQARTFAKISAFQTGLAGEVSPGAQAVNFAARIRMIIIHAVVDYQPMGLSSNHYHGPAVLLH